jgi:hypothetical protein
MPIGQPTWRARDQPLRDPTSRWSVLSPSCGDASALLLPQLGLPENLIRGPTLGPAAAVGAFGVVVAQVALEIEAEPGLLGIR